MTAKKPTDTERYLQRCQQRAGELKGIGRHNYGRNIADLNSQLVSTQRRQEKQITGSLELAYMRGYQAGWEDGSIKRGAALSPRGLERGIKDL